MSLYADEDLTLTSYSNNVPSTVDADPVSAFATALAAPPESPAQDQALLDAGSRFEQQPDKLPELCAQLLPMVVEGNDTMLRRWALEMVLLAVGRAKLAGEVKLQVAQTSLSALLTLLLNPSTSPLTLKPTISILSTIHPLLFRLLASPPPSLPRDQLQQLLDAFNSSKTRIVALALDPDARPQSVGVKGVAWKFVQRVLGVGTRLGTGAVDPRLAKSQSSDPHVGLITRDSPLSAPDLEQEALALRNTLITQLFQLDQPALLHPIINIIPLLCKQRPTLAPAFITSLTTWSPAQLEARGRSAMQVRAVEKTLRSVMAHLLRHPPLAMYSVQLNDALQRQKSRLEVSWETEQRVRRAKRAAATQGVPSGFDASAGAGPSNLGKHANAYETVDWYGAKRARVDAGTEIGSGSGKGHAVDVSGLRVDEVVEYVMAGLRGLDPATISRAFDNARSNIAQDNGDAMYDLAPVLGMADPRAGQYGQVSGVGQHGHPPGPGYGSGAGTGAGAVKEEKEEVLDPLEMDMEDDELLADDESETDEAITFANFTLPPPELPSLEERDEMIEDILKRISDSGQEMAGAAATVVAGTTDPWAWLTSASAAASSEGGGGKDGLRGIMDVKEMWMLLLSRLATRAGAIAQGDGDADEVKAEGVNGSKGEAMIREKGRRRVAEFIAGDFAARSKFAALWLNEEWYTEKLSSPTGTCPLYTSHLLSILSSHLAKLDGHSSTATSSARSLSLFLANVPQIPLELVDQLATLAEDPDRAIVGFLALRDLVESRPPVRAKALGKLLDLCVHPDRKVRVLGISTVRRWVPGHKVSVEVVGFAEKVLARLGYAQEAKLAEAGSKPEVEDGEGEEKKVDPEDAPMDGDAPADAAAARAETEETKETKPAPVELPTDLADLSHFLPAPSTSSIQQHVELPFALSRRDPSLLDNIFALYPTLPPFIQGQYEDLLVPLIQSLAVGPVAARPVPPPNAPSGPKAEVAANGTDAPTDAAPATQTPAPVPAPAPLSPSEKLMGLLREYPAEGTEKLVLRVISTLSKEGKSATVRDLVRGWVEQKGEDVDVRFVVPVLGELSRAEIEAQIPRIVTLLNTPDSRDTVRTAFATLIQKLTPADLLVALHNESTAIKPTIEAIGICFSMTTVFRSDVLVASMVRIADLPSGSLPIVFMRTIIQAVTTYKSLVPFVANTVLPKLVSKKIWSAGPQLWDGFIRLARLIAPASYGVLLQLPKEWLKDVLEKQPALKTGLKTFLAAKQGGRGVLVELFGDQA